MDLHTERQAMTDNLGSHTLVLGVREAVDRGNAAPGSSAREQLTALAIAVISTGLVVSGSLAAWPGPKPAVQAAPIVSVQSPAQPDVLNPYEMVVLEAQAAVVYDVHADKVLFTQNGRAVRPLASLTKLMTSLVAYEALNPDTSVSITPDAIWTEGDSGLYADETWKLRDLISFLMMTSSNDGAEAVALAVGAVLGGTMTSTPEHSGTEVFVDAMNRRARDLGLVDTRYNNPSGLDDASGRYGGVGTTEDMARLMAYVWEQHPEAFDSTTTYSAHFTSEDGFVHEAVNTNEYVDESRGLLGSKTGYTKEAGGNLAVIYDAGMDHPVVVVVLGSSIDGRFSDVRTLTDATNDYIGSGWYEYNVAGSTDVLQ